MFSLYQGGSTVGREESQGCVKSILVQVTRNRYFLLHNRKSRLNEKNILCNVCTCIIFINSKYISHLYVCVLYFFFHLLMQLIYVRSLSYMIEHTFNLQFPCENTIIFFFKCSWRTAVVIFTSFSPALGSLVFETFQRWTISKLQLKAAIKFVDIMVGIHKLTMKFKNHIHFKKTLRFLMISFREKLLLNVNKF